MLIQSYRCRSVVVASSMVILLSRIFSTNFHYQMSEFPGEDDNIPVSDAQEGIYNAAAVVSNTQPVSIVGRNILARGGSAVDAMIACLLCEGLTAMQNMGLGGGVFMTIYKRDRRRAFFIDAREAAPLRATRDMFMGDPAMSSSGGTAIAVPGELMGYWEAHQRFGILPWRDLFQPAISMCINGIPINARLAKSFAHSGMEGEILQSPTLRQVLAPSGRLPRAGEIMTIPTLARTLATIAEDRSGAMALYNGSLTESFLQDLQSVGSSITRDDLALYRANWHEPITARLSGGYTLYTAPPPASGSVLAFILQTLEGQLQPNPRFNLFNTLRVAEAFKYAYALRTELGDPAFTNTNQVLQKSMNEDYIGNVASRLHQLTRTESNPEYYGASYHSGNKGGTINVVVQAPDGDAVVATSTINTLSVIDSDIEMGCYNFTAQDLVPNGNVMQSCTTQHRRAVFMPVSLLNAFLYPGRTPEIQEERSAMNTMIDRFGSLMASPSTGIILNNEMDDFSSPHIVNSFGVTPSRANFIQGGKRPLSSAAPSIVVGQNGNVRLAIGSAGGTHITSAVAQVIMNHLWFGMSIKQAVDMPRIHHQLLPMVLRYEYGIPKSVINGLARAGHKTRQISPHSSVTAVATQDDQVTAIYDYRRGGNTSGF